MKKVFLAFSLSIMAAVTYADQITITMYSTEQSTEKLGVVNAQDTRYGLLLTPHLQGLPAGVHGFHVHDKMSCEEHGMAAGGHLDPMKTGKHLGPYNTSGHLGDLPVLIVNQDGTATLPVLAPRLSVKEIKGHSLMIHAGADNYSDIPEKLGGGGARIACGIIK